MFSSLLTILIVILVVAVILFVFTIKRLIYICQPNEVLIFSGHHRQVGRRELGYTTLIGGSRVKRPLIERVDRMDLTNMIIEVNAVNAFSKGGIPLTVQGVANIKIAGDEPVLNNAIERFLGKSRQEIIQIAKATLEGALRGVLATLTPEQVNEDKLLFAEKLVLEAEKDITDLGLVVDTLKIQNVQDDLGYLDSIGRQKNAEIIRQARIAEANAKADAVVRSAENREREVRSQIEAQIEVSKADAAKRLTEITTRRAALVAEERATVAAAVAQSKAEIDVQKARVEQIRRKLEADVVQPAKAACQAAEEEARASAAPIIEDGKAQAEALNAVSEQYRKAGKNGRKVLLLQKLDPILATLTNTISDVRIEKVTLIDTGSAAGAASGSLPAKALYNLEQIKQIFGVDLVEKLQSWSASQQPRPSSGPR
ncbi:MAG: hypothetical protein JW797_19550 [Bradymonadales bacterium]|nr:hypothetical protein [Bradymonadales bacterium]